MERGRTLPPSPPSAWSYTKYSNVDITEDTVQSTPSHPKPRRSRGWVPVPLRRIALLSFLGIFTLILASLLTIYFLAARQNGLKMLTTNHYAWTYGPTAVFVIVISFWRLSDYHCKALQPWKELETSATAHRSVWLDHVSSFIIVALVKAIKLRHFAVVLTIGGFLVLKLVTLASTGLFLTDIAVMGPFAVAMKQTTGIDNVTAISDPNTMARSTKIGATTMYTFYAVKERGLLPPLGIDNHVLYETYIPAVDAGSPNMTYQSIAQAFKPSAKCIPISVEVNFNATQYEQYQGAFQGWGLNITSDTGLSCEQWELDLNPLLTMSAGTQLCPPRQLVPIYPTINCNSTNQTGGADPQTFQLLGMADLRYSQVFNFSTEYYAYGDPIKPESYSFNISTVTMALCQISHELLEVQVAYNESNAANPNGVITMIEGFNASTIPHLTPSLLTQTTWGVTAAGGAIYGSSIHLDIAEQPPNAFFKLAAASAGGDYEVLLDAATMVDAYENVLSNLAIYTVNTYMTYPTNKTVSAEDVDGRLSYSEVKLQVQETSLIIMAAGIVTMLMLTSALLFVRPDLKVNPHPGSILRNVAVLQKSQSFHDHLKKLQWLDEKEARSCTYDSTYHTISSSDLTPVLQQTTSLDHTSSPQFVRDSSIPKHQSYAPFTMKLPFMILTLIVGPILIIVLEILQRRSDASAHGLRSFVNSTTFEQSVLTRYVPGLIALLVATLFNVFDFNTIVLARYNAMRRTATPATTLSDELLARFPPSALYSAIKHGYWGAFLSGSAALVGSVLTIAASGLYVLEYVPDTSNGQVTILEAWNTSFHEGLSGDNATAAVVSLIESLNMTQPLYTFDELAFPAISFGFSENDSVLEAGYVTISLPALRADLQCTAFDSSEIKTKSNPEMGGSTPSISSDFGNISVPLPENCRLGSQYGNESVIPIPWVSSQLTSPNNITYNAEYLDLHVGPWKGGFADTGTVFPGQPDNPAGCPSVFLSWAYLDGNDSSKSAISAYYCEQKIQSLSVNLTLHVPDMSIPVDNPPVPDESSVRYINSGENNETAFWWRLQPGIDNALVMLNETAIDEYDPPNEAYVVSDFFVGAMTGKTPFPFSWLGAVDQDTKDKVFDHLQMFYRRYMAQYMSANMRIPATGEAQHLPGAFMSDTGIPVLKQSRTNTIIIQAMLGVMFICGTVAWCIGTYRDLVPWNPCTIMGTMVLLAGSKYCDATDGALLSDRQREESSHAMYTTGGDDAMEMDNFNFSSSGTLEYRPMDERPRQRFGSLRKGSMTVTSSSIQVKELEGTRWRLGWWRDGIYLGLKRPVSDRERPIDEILRYGLDVVE